ncbi:hypothetical protein DEU34_3003 [Microbacterium sp. AG1240]|nr:hypothetical protein DEU34_3003 [Microbacterium sp. AG1240]
MYEPRPSDLDLPPTASIHVVMPDASVGGGIR